MVSLANKLFFVIDIYLFGSLVARRIEKCQLLQEQVKKNLHEF